MYTRASTCVAFFLVSSSFFHFFSFFFFLFFSSERTAFLGVSKRARQHPRCDTRGAACNHLNQCTYTLYHSIIIYTGCTARTANVSRRYFIRKDSRRRFAFPRYPSISSVFLGPTPRSTALSVELRFFLGQRCIVTRRIDAVLSDAYDCTRVYTEFTRLVFLFLLISSYRR